MLELDDIQSGVLRPRPTGDLVRVTSDLEEASFPSGHVVHYVTFYGFLYFLVSMQPPPGWAAAVLTRGDRGQAGGAVVSGSAAAPLEPGLLPLREGPLLEPACATSRDRLAR